MFLLSFFKRTTSISITCLLVSALLGSLLLPFSVSVMAQTTELNAIEQAKIVQDASALTESGLVNPAANQNPTKAGQNEEEIVSMRDAYSKFFKQTVVGESATSSRIIGRSFSDAIHWKSGSSWLPINSIIIPDSSVSGFAYRNSSNSFSVRFGLTPSDGFLYEGNGLSLRIGTLTIDGVVVNNSPAVISANTITYPNILPEVDLQYIVTSTGISKKIILKSAAALANNPTAFSSVTFAIVSTNRDLIQTGNEGTPISISGLSNIFLSAPITYEANGQGERFESYSLASNDSSLTLFPNLDFLHNPARNFPLIIDPNLETRSANEDYYTSPMNFDTPTGVNGKPILIGDYYEGTSTPPVTFTNSQGFLRFVNLNPAAVNIRLKVFHYGTTTGAFTAKIRALTNYYPETTASFPNRVPTMAGNLGVADLPFANRNHPFSHAWTTSSDITGIIRGQGSTAGVVGSFPNHVVIGIDGNDSNEYGAVFCSKEEVQSNIGNSSHPCFSSNGNSSYLEYEINQPPTATFTSSTYPFTEQIGECDRSTTRSTYNSLTTTNITNPTNTINPQYPGNCSGKDQVTLQLDNISDGEHAPNSPFNFGAYHKFIVSTNNQATWQADLDFENPGAPYASFGPDKPSATKVYLVRDRDVYLKAELRDQYLNPATYIPAGRFIIDTTPPISPSFTLSEFSKGTQISVIVPPTTDNISGKTSNPQEAQLSYYLEASTDSTFTDRSKLVYPYVCESSHASSTPTNLACVNNYPANSLTDPSASITNLGDPTNPQSPLYLTSLAMGWQNTTYINGVKQPMEFQIPNLLDNTTYYYQVKTRDRIVNPGLPLSDSQNKGNTSPWSAIVSSTQDATLPLIVNANFPYNRFSPTNVTSTNKFDTLTLTIDLSEKNLKNISLNVLQPAANPNNPTNNATPATLKVATLTECKQLITQAINPAAPANPDAAYKNDPNSYTAPFPCNANNLVNPYPNSANSTDPANHITVQFVWNGLGYPAIAATATPTNPQTIPQPDGAYILQPIVTDLTDSTNKLANPASQPIGILDDTGANIALTSPANKYWTNDLFLGINGSVAVFNNSLKEDRDWDKILNSTLVLTQQHVVDPAYIQATPPATPTTDPNPNPTTEDITSLVDITNNFTYNPLLQLGLNRFTFTSTDTVANEIDVVGNSANSASSLVKNWDIYVEQTQPVINSVSIRNPTTDVAAVSSLINTTNSINPLTNLLPQPASFATVNTDGVGYVQLISPNSSNLVNSVNATNLRNPVVSFTATDPASLANLNLPNPTATISGLSTGINPTGYSVSLLTSTNFDSTLGLSRITANNTANSNPQNPTINSLNTANWSETPLFVNGVNVNSSLVTSLVCTPTANAITTDPTTIANSANTIINPNYLLGTTAAASQVNCSFAMQNLQPDNSYRVVVKVQDVASNSSCNTQLSNSSILSQNLQCNPNAFPVSNTNSNKDLVFALNSATKLEVTAPVQNSMKASSLIQTSGKAERGSSVRLANQELENVAQISLPADPNSNIYSTSFLLEPDANNNPYCATTVTNQNDTYFGLATLVSAPFGCQPDANSTNPVANPFAVTSQATAKNLFTSPISTNQPFSSSYQPTFVQSPITLVCGLFEDIDQNPATPDREMCSYSFSTTSLSNFDPAVLITAPAASQNPAVQANTVTTLSVNSANITGTIITNFQSDLYNISLSSNPDLTYISPNGDGRQDGILFSNQATNSDDPTDVPAIINYQLNIQQKAVSTFTNPNPTTSTSFIPTPTEAGFNPNSLVYTETNMAQMPTQIMFDGKGCSSGVDISKLTSITPLPTSSNQCLDQSSFTWLPDGDYQFNLSVTTSDGVSIVLPPRNIFVRTSLLASVVITTPTDGYITSRGSINVQGQAPVSTNSDGQFCDPISGTNPNTNNPSNPNPSTNPCFRGQTLVAICVDTITVPNTISCDLIQTVSVDANGFFTTIVTLPLHSNNGGNPVNPTTGQDQASFVITAIARDSYGNTTNPSNSVQVTYDTTEILKSLTITPTFQGLNTQQDINKFLAGQLSIDEIRSLAISTTVSQNTQAVQLQYADYTNLPELPGTDPRSGYAPIMYPNGNISLMDNTTETNIRFNPAANFNFKLNHFRANPSATVQGLISSNTNSPCLQLTCLFQTYYPIPFFFPGGQYELIATGFKGTDSQQLSAGFVLDGRITAQPRLLRIEKNLPNASKAIATEGGIPAELSETLYPNPADPANPIAPSQTATAAYSNTLQNTLTGVADPNTIVTITLTNQYQQIQTYTTTTSSTGVWEMVVTLPDPVGSNPTQNPIQNQNLQDLYHITLTAQLPGSVTSTSSQTPAYLVIDTKAPAVASVITSTADENINPWASSFDTVQISSIFNEHVTSVDIIKVDGYVASMKALANAAPLNPSSITHSNAIYSTNITLTSFVETVYSPIIQATDLAGNTARISNDSSRIQKECVDLKALANQNYLSFTSFLSCQLIDVAGSQVINPAPNSSGNTTIIANPAFALQPLPANYPYHHTNKAASLDFRFFVDNTVPDSQAFSFNVCSNLLNTQNTEQTTQALCWGRENNAEFIFNAETGNTNPITIDQNWTTKQTNDGLKASKQAPETDRVILNYVVSSNQVTLTMSAEANQFIQLSQFNRTNSNTVLAKIPVINGYTRTNAVESSAKVGSSYANSTDTVAVVCPNTFPHQTANDTSITNSNNPVSLTNPLTTKFATNCTITYTYFFPYSGISPNGVPVNFTTFQTRIIDLAGNISPRNQSVTIYKDTQSPFNPSIETMNSASYSPVVGWSSRGANQNSNSVPITKDTSMYTLFNSERLSDLTIQTSRTVNTKQPQTTTTQTIRTGSNSPNTVQNKAAR